MKIIINASLNYTTGGLQVALSFINECITFKENRYHIFINQNIYNNIDFTVFPSNFDFYKIPNLKFYQYNSYLSLLEKQILPDIVYSIFGPVYWRPKVPHIMGFALGHYIYNDSPFWKKTPLYTKGLWWMKKKIHYFFLKRDADAFIVETNDVKERLNNFLVKPCYVVANTYSEDFKNVIITQHLLPPPLEGEFRLLSPCRNYSHKNLSIIPKVLDILYSKGYHKIIFVLTLNETDFSHLIPKKYRKSVFNIGNVNPHNLPQLYMECNATFVPSLLECFTANFPESMIMKKPILASDLSFSHSICGDSALYFKPLEPLDIAEKIIELIYSPILMDKLINSGLDQVSLFKTAQERAKSYLDICSNFITK